MTPTDENRLFFPAWGISLALHGIVVGLAVAFATQIKPQVREENFQWDVALVEATKPASATERIPSTVPAEHLPARVMPQPRPKRVTELSETSEPLEKSIEPPMPMIESIQQVEQKVEPPQPREELSVQRAVDPVVETTAPEPVTVVTPPEAGESLPAQHETVAVAAQQEAPAEARPQDAQAESAPVQVAKVAGPSAETKFDHQWLAESLWRRVAELKRYPNSARMNGQEGRVIVRAVIRSDGQLADVSVQKSSGHSTLDSAAMEAVKLACPLYMKHAIGKPQIVVSLPIVYSLAN